MLEDGLSCQIILCTFQPLSTLSGGQIGSLVIDFLLLLISQLNIFSATNVCLKTVFNSVGQQLGQGRLRTNISIILLVSEVYLQAVKDNSEILVRYKFTMKIDFVRVSLFIVARGNTFWWSSVALKDCGKIAEANKLGDQNMLLLGSHFRTCTYFINLAPIIQIINLFLMHRFSLQFNQLSWPFGWKYNVLINLFISLLH